MRVSLLNPIELRRPKRLLKSLQDFDIKQHVNDVHIKKTLIHVFLNGNMNLKSGYLFSN